MLLYPARGGGGSLIKLSELEMGGLLVVIAR